MRMTNFSAPIRREFRISGHRQEIMQFSEETMDNAHASGMTCRNKLFLLPELRCIFLNEFAFSTSNQKAPIIVDALQNLICPFCVTCGGFHSAHRVDLVVVNF